MTGSYMVTDGFYDKVAHLGVIPVVVLDRVEHAFPLGEALVKGGLPAAEVTFRTDAAAGCIRALSGQFPDMAVGAGTVLDLEQAKRAVDAGASFVVSPGHDIAVVDWCLQNKIAVVPAGVTPTEVTALVNRGIDVTKFFPAGVYGGRKAIDALASVFVGHRFMPTGGVNASNLREYLQDEAIIACGGSWMCAPTLYGDGDFSKVERLAREARDIVRDVCAGVGE